MKIMERVTERINFGVVSGSILSVAGLRVLMAPLPNVEPIMLFTIVTALTLGPISGFIFGAGSMFISDFFMGRAGPWTLYTSLAFGFVGILVGLIGTFTRNKNWNKLKGRAELFGIAFIMTIFWDLITATFFAFEFFIPWYTVMITQIPFTLLHLSNCAIVPLFAPHLMKVFSAAKNFSILTWVRKNLIYHL
jgi:uncharacterized membrane protein